MNYSFINTGISPTSSVSPNPITNQFSTLSPPVSRIYEPTRGTFHNVYNVFPPNAEIILYLNKYYQSSPMNSWEINGTFQQFFTSPEPFSYHTCEVEGTISYLTGSLIQESVPTYFNMIFNSLYLPFDEVTAVSGIGEMFNESYKVWSGANNIEATDGYTYTTNYNENPNQPATTPLIDPLFGNKISTTNLFFDTGSSEYFLNFVLAVPYNGPILIKGFFNLY